MPIQGLTTNNEAAFPRIGVIRKGGPKPEGKIGPDLSYFRFTADDPELVDQFHATFGDQPRAINVYIPFATTDEAFQTWREAWKAGGLLHRCDGDTTVMLRLPDGTYSQEPTRCPGAATAQNRDGCKPVGRLTVWIPEFERLAFVTVLTTSKWDLLELSRNLRAAEVMRGSLLGIPFVLRRRERMISVPDGNGGRRRLPKWLLSIEPVQQWVSLQLAAMRRAALPSGLAPLQLAAPQPDDEDDDAVGDVFPSARNGHANGATQRVVNGQETIKDRVDFWTRAKVLRTPPFTNDDIHEILRVDSVKDWLADGGTWQSAYDEVYRVVAAAATESEPPDEYDDPDDEPTTVNTPSGKVNTASGEIVTPSADEAFNALRSASPPKLEKAQPLPMPDDTVKRRQLTDRSLVAVDAARAVGVQIPNMPDPATVNLNFYQQWIGDLEKATASKVARAGKVAVAAK